ncbi:MAG: exodeoxyribonuclease VII small subunit [candidate division WOR-3 bacterium]|jgi:exodeoxyribonuclease VII small subunit
MKFEESLNRLEEIVKNLEEGEISLEESLPLFEKGIKILTELKEYLSKAETRIEKLIKDSEGQFRTDEYRELSDDLEEES